MCSWFPDVLGSGFYARTIRTQTDSKSQLATLVRYEPQADPLSTLPDRVIPSNLNFRKISLSPGISRRQLLVLPPAASPQNRTDLDVFTRRAHSSTVPRRMYFAKSDSRKIPTEQDLDHLQNNDPLAGLYELQSVDELDPAPAPAFCVLYIHGWNDYFFQTHLAKVIAHLGGAFYALDLHNYGRSLDYGGLRTPPTPKHYDNDAQLDTKIDNGYETDFNNFYTEIDAAWEIISQENPGLPRIIFGHSQGGLLASAYAASTKRELDGMILNSPWLAHDWGGLPMPTVLSEAVSVWGKMFPRRTVNQPLDLTYARSLDGYRKGSMRSQRLNLFTSDPSVHGWFLHPRWKLSPYCPMWMGAARAVLKAHNTVHQGLRLSFPILAMNAPATVDSAYGNEVSSINRVNLQTGYMQNEWNEAARHTDTVLNGDLVSETILTKLGSHVHHHALSGVHDLCLSQPIERAVMWATMRDWFTTHFPIGQDY